MFYFHLSKDIPVEIEPRIKERDMGKYAGVPFYDLTGIIFGVFILIKNIQIANQWQIHFLESQILLTN